MECRSGLCGVLDMGMEFVHLEGVEWIELSGLKEWLQKGYASRDCGDEGVEE